MAAVKVQAKKFRRKASEIRMPGLLTFFLIFFFFFFFFLGGGEGVFCS